MLIREGKKHKRIKRLIWDENPNELFVFDEQDFQKEIIAKLLDFSPFIVEDPARHRWEQWRRKKILQSNKDMRNEYLVPLAPVQSDWRLIAITPKEDVQLLGDYYGESFATNKELLKRHEEYLVIPKNRL